MEKFRTQAKILKTIASPVKLRLIDIISKNSLTLKEIHKIIFKDFKIKYPQTTYNYLERLISIGLITKYYDQVDKNLKYRLIKSKYIINFKTSDYIIE